MTIISWIRLLFVVFLPSCVSFGFSNPPNSQPNNLQNMIKIHPKHNVFHHAFLGFVTAWTIGTTSVCVTSPLPCLAAESRLIGQIAGSGLLFKDTLNVESFDDPKVRGVTLYVSNFQRPLTERLSKDFFSDPSYASVGCAKTSPAIEIADNINTSPQGEQVFEESKSLLFKTLRVQRIYDKEKNTVVYVSFNTRLDKNEDTNKSRFKSSICAVNLD